MPFEPAFIRDLQSEFHVESGRMKKDFVNGKDRRASYPFISGDGFRAMCAYRCEDHVKHDGCIFSPEDVRPGGCVYVATTNLKTLKTTTKYLIEFAKIAHLITQNFVVVTHNGDLSTPDGDDWHEREGSLWSEKFSYLLHTPNLLAWFASNCHWTGTRSKPDKLFCIPIGIENRYNKIGKNPMAYFHWMERRAHVKASKTLLVAFSAHHQKPFRAPALAALSAGWITRSMKGWKAWYEAVQEHKFVACPIGHGYDTHRAWEVLLAGSIPVVETTTMDSMYEHLPVLIVQNWTEVTRPFLDDVYDRFRNRKTFMVEKLFFRYWRQLILNRTHVARTQVTP